MNSVRQGFKHKLPKLAANILLALVFGAIGSLSSVTLTGVVEGVGFFSWLVFTLVGIAFLVRALFAFLPVGDDIVKLFRAHLGMQKRLSKKRVANDLIYIIATILATAAIFPFLSARALGGVANVLQTATTILAVGVIFLSIYDIARIFYQIFYEKASAVTSCLVHKEGEEIK